MAMRKFFFAIKHKPSGGFLPQMASYGFTRCEPTLKEPPRLFTKIGPARQALDRWLRGEWYEKFGTDEEITVAVVARPDRRAVEMEIVEIEITPRSLSEAQLRSL